MAKGHEICAYWKCRKPITPGTAWRDKQGRPFCSSACRHEHEKLGKEYEACREFKSMQGVDKLDQSGRIHNQALKHNVPAGAGSGGKKAARAEKKAAQRLLKEEALRIKQAWVKQHPEVAAAFVPSVPRTNIPSLWQRFMRWLKN